MSNEPSKTKRAKIEECMRMGANCTCLHLRKATRAITAMFDEVFSPLGIRITQFGLLAMLYAREKASVNQLADALVMDRTTLTRNLKLLAEAGLTEEIRGEDRRTRLWLLTKEGLACYQKGISYWEEAQKRVDETLGETLVQDLHLKLRQVVASFQ